MNLQELEAQVTHLEDVHEIENLERIYGFYFDSRQMNKILDLFSENAESVEIESHGVYYGKEGVRKMYGLAAGRQLGKPAPPPPPPARNVAHGTVIIQIGGVVHIKPDGKSATGRWHTWLAENFPLGGNNGQYWLHGYYENKFVKENGRWLFSKLYWNTTFYTRFETGWLVQPLVGLLPMPGPDAPPTAFHPYPSGYHLPYSFPHPITGEIDQTTFEQKNPMTM
jgi:hypothetical protein